jgi:chemotaxis signal transduction protein
VSERTLELHSFAADMRRAFDESFARPADGGGDAFEDFLLLRAGDATYAVRLLATSGLFTDRLVVPLPSTVRGFMGVTAFRNSVVPVYSLPELLGPSTDSERLDWLVLLGTTNVVGLAVEQFHSHVRIQSDEVVRGTASRAGSPRASEVIRIGATTVPVLDTSTLIEEIERRCRARGASEERPQ